MPTSNMPSVSSTAAAFLESVLRLKPRLVAFDCDGTLWSGDAGEGFFRWEMDHGMVSDETIRWAKSRYQDYQAGKVSEDDMCADMTTMNVGLDEATIRKASRQFYEENIAADVFFVELKCIS